MTNPDYSEADPDRFVKAIEQPWERFRGSVAAHQAASRATESEPEHGDRWSQFEHRLQVLEGRIESQGQKIQHMEVTIVRQLESLTIAYQHMAANLDKMVTRAEFDPVKWIAYLSAASVFLMGLSILMSRAGAH